MVNLNREGTRWICIIFQDPIRTSQ